MQDSPASGIEFDVIAREPARSAQVLAARSEGSGYVGVGLLEAGARTTRRQGPCGSHSPNFFDAMMEPGRIWPDLRRDRAAEQPETPTCGFGAGGSSSVNAMGALRGTVDDYERWADELGCAGWGWPEMLATFLRVEDDADYGGDGLHGSGGPIPLWRVPSEELPPMSAALRAALTDVGFPTCDDYHAPGATGISRWALTMRDRQRVSTNDAYLDPARPRPNLVVRGDALVDRAAPAGAAACASPTAPTWPRGDRERGRSTHGDLLRSGTRRRPAPVGATSRTTPPRRASRWRSRGCPHAVAARPCSAAAALLVRSRRRRPERPPDRVVRRDRRMTHRWAGGSSARSCGCSRRASFACAHRTPCRPGRRWDAGRRTRWHGCATRPARWSSSSTRWRRSRVV